MYKLMDTQIIPDSYPLQGKPVDFEHSSNDSAIEAAAALSATSGGTFVVVPTAYGYMVVEGTKEVTGEFFFRVDGRKVEYYVKKRN